MNEFKKIVRKISDIAYDEDICERNGLGICGTKYDWYVFIKIPKTNYTIKYTHLIRGDLIEMYYIKYGSVLEYVDGNALGVQDVLNTLSKLKMKAVLLRLQEI